MQRRKGAKAIACGSRPSESPHKTSSLAAHAYGRAICARRASSQSISHYAHPRIAFLAFRIRVLRQCFSHSSQIEICIPQRLIDEVQRGGPDLLLAVKSAVDKDQTPGQFFLTGSANVLADSGAIPHPLGQPGLAAVPSSEGRPGRPVRASPPTPRRDLLGRSRGPGPACDPAVGRRRGR